MEKDSSGIGGTSAKLLRRERGSRCSHLTSSSSPEALKGDAFPLEPQSGSPESGRGVASRGSPAPGPGGCPRGKRWGLEAARRLPAQPAALAGAARPRSSARGPSPLPPSGCSCCRAGGA